jgi:hypothetical protein
MDHAANLGTVANLGYYRVHSDTSSLGGGLNNLQYITYFHKTEC